jgi:hypothetical protein
LDRLHDIAKATVESAAIKPGESVPGYTNTTPYVLHIPGGNKGYPAFWVRDAAMMLGADFVSAKDIEGWVTLIASVQAPESGLKLKNGLIIPPYSIPDHVTVTALPCWYPGAYEGEDQGNGTYGFLPPADDAFYFIQMIAEHNRLAKKPDLFTKFETSAVHAFESVEVNDDGLVVCSDKPDHTRVDWGFCDSIRKTGACLMPSLLRWRAAKDLETLYRASNQPQKTKQYRDTARLIAQSIGKSFTPEGKEPTLLFSSTDQGHQEDVWASAYAVWLGVLPKATSKRVSLRLLELYQKGGTIFEGQARSLPVGQFWEKAGGQGYYQNGAYWGTPTGWIVYALSKVDKKAASKMLSEFVDSLEKNKDKGAPWECFNSSLNHYQNPQYCATVALPFAALKDRM